MLRNATLPIIMIIGLQTGLLLSGVVLTETVFAWPGIERGLKDGFARDYPALQGGILFLAAVFVVVNLLVDISAAFLNPRDQAAMTVAQIDVADVLPASGGGLRATPGRGCARTLARSSGASSS